MKIRPIAWFVFFFLLSSYGALVGLDNTVFWDDEAYVGIIARNYLEQGHFTGWTGRNLYAYANGTVLSSTLRPINPPLDVLVMATSFALLGTSTWAGRIPFVLAGLLALALFGAIVRREWKENPTAQIYAFGFLALSVVFLLNIRTGRYYALTLLFSMGCYYAYQSTFLSRHRRDFLLLALCAIGLFYSHYLMCVLFLLSLGSLHLALRAHEWSKAQWRLCALAVLLFLAATLPYAFAFRIWYRPDLAPSSIPWSLSRVLLLNLNFAGLSHGNFLSLGITAGILLLLGVPRLRTRFAAMLPHLRAWLLIVVAYIFWEAMLSAMPVYGPHGLAELRYFLPILPFCAGLAGLCLSALHQYSRLAALALFVCLVSCNAATTNPFSNQVRWLLPAFAREIHQPYPTGGSETMKFLRANARQDEVVRIVSHHHNYPVLFYMNDRLRFGALLDRQTPIAPATVSRMGKFLMLEETFPDWLIFFSRTNDWKMWTNYLARPVFENGRWISHPYRLVKTLDVYYDQSQRPEVPWHSFGPPSEYDPAKEAVYIYRRSTPVQVKSPAPGQTVAPPNARH